MRPPTADELLDQFGDALIAVDPVGHVLTWSRGAEEIFGYRRDEAVGRRLPELVVPEELREEESERIRTAVERGSASFESVRRRKDGESVQVEVTMRAVAGADGAIAYVAISMKDRRTEARFRDLLEAAPDAIVIADRGGRIAIVNAQAEKLFGYDRAELVGQPVEMLVPRMHRVRHASHRDRYFADPRARPMGSALDLHAVRKDGTTFPVEISLSPLETGDGILVSSAIRDVTARRETENALRLAYSELESFSYSIAHDLRAPLRGMNGFAQILLEEYGDRLDPEGLDHLREIRGNAMRMSALIDALLGLSRVSRVPLRRTRVDLGQLARSLAARLSGSDCDRAVDLAIEADLVAWADATLVRTLLDNLLGNAWKFTRPTAAPRVQVGAVEQDGNRVFFVRDNGAGFDMAYAGRLFGAFQRLHSEREFPGTGIGLATAQRIVHRHGGRISAEGAVGEGATFFFTLPGDERTA